MAEKLGVAVIGVGIYGEVHVRAYKNDPRVSLLWVWSRSEERSKKVGEKYQCEHTTDLRRIAEDERVNIVSIATPDFAHTLPAVMMLEAGKHVLVEKPMATSSADCERILEARNKSRKKLMVNFHNRWYPPIAHAKQLIDAGEIGEPVLCYARLSDQIVVPTEWLSWAEDSGPEWFLFPHLIDLVRWLFSQEVCKVFATGRKGILKKRGIDCYDAIQAQLELSNSIATIETSWILPRSWRSVIDFKIDIVGSKGRIGIEGDRESIDLATDNLYSTPFILDPTTTELLPFQHFIECVIEDKPPSCTGEEGLIVTKIIEGILESMERGTPAKISKGE